MTNQEYYVYVYIDPRNYEEFYYGKGIGSRKLAHLKDDGDTEKTKIIKSILKEGLKPIIKVVARNLTADQALLVEKTLIWKLGKTLTNISSGHYADKFRAKDTLHLNLFGFDYNNGIYYVNVGEGKHRCWEDCKQFGFLSAGQDPKYSNPLKTLQNGDIVVAYLKGKGYVGIGKVIDEVKKINDFTIDNKPLFQINIKEKGMFENSDNENSEYLAKIEWIKTVERNEAKFKSNSKLFTSQLVKATLENQPTTLKFLEEEFNIQFNEILNN